MNKKVINGFVATFGYILSPLSWWNDLFINIPIAYGFAFLFGLISKNLFTPMLIIGYWLTNILGFILMHKGTERFLRPGKNAYTRKELTKDLIFSILYALVIVTLIKLEWIKFPTEYFK